jgi:hypothetical protein
MIFHGLISFGKHTTETATHHMDVSQKDHSGGGIVLNYLEYTRISLNARLVQESTFYYGKTNGKTESEKIHIDICIPLP